MKTFNRPFKHLSQQSPACSLLYTTSHDPEQQLQVIDDARRGSSVAALPTARAYDEFSSDNEGGGVFDAVSSHNMEVAEDNVSIGDNEVPVGNDVSSDEEVDANEDFSVDDKEATLPDDEVSSDNKDVLADHEISSNDEDVLGDDEVDSDRDSNAKTGKPDTSVLELFHLLSKLRSNPLELARFTMRIVSMIYFDAKEVLHLSFPAQQ
jgi:hypothetical protein